MSGQQPRGELGVWMTENDGPGVRILRVTPGSAADQAGLRVGDFVLQVNGRGASSPQRAADLIREIPIGQSGTLTIWRNGDQQQLRITMQPARERTRDVVSDMGREMGDDSYQVGFHEDERSTGGDSSRIMRLEQQIGSLTQELATMRQEMAQLRSAGSVHTAGFNADVNQGSAPPAQPAPNAAPASAAAPAPASAPNTVGPPPGFGKADDKANSAPEPPKSAAPAAAAEPAKSAPPAAPAEKPAASDPFGSDAAQPKNAEKPKSDDKPKADDKKAGDKGATDDLFK